MRAAALSRNVACGLRGRGAPPRLHPYLEVLSAGEKKGYGIGVSVAGVVERSMALAVAATATAPGYPLWILLFCLYGTRGRLS